jgi:hypothetical protein
MASSGRYLGDIGFRREVRWVCRIRRDRGFAIIVPVAVWDAPIGKIRAAVVGGGRCEIRPIARLAVRGERHGQSGGWAPLDRLDLG